MKKGKGEVYVANVAKKGGAGFLLETIILESQWI